MNRGGVTVHLHLFLTPALGAHYISTYNPGPIMPKRYNLFYPVGPLAGVHTFRGNSLLHSTIRTSTMQPVCSLVNSNYSNPDGRTSKCIFHKYSLQLQTTLNKLNTGYGYSLSAVHNKLSDLGIFKLVLNTVQTSDYNKVFPVDTTMSSQMTEWFLLSSLLLHSSI